MARLDWKVSVTPIEEVGEDAAGGGVKTEVISYNFKTTLGGGTSSGTWGGNDSGEWVNGALDAHLTANGGIIATPASCEGVWVKNTGFVYDAGATDKKGTTKADDDSTVSLTIGSVVVAVLGVGEGMFFPNPANSDADFITLDDGGTDDVAVEYALFV